MTKNNIFGENVAKKFNIGDLVSWVELNEHAYNKSNRDVVYGILMNIVHKQFGDRLVVFGKVMPTNSNKYVEIVITNLRKVETN